MENTNWTDYSVKVPLKYLDDAAAIMQMASSTGIYIEDYSDIEEKTLEITHMDLIEEELLKKDRTTATVHIYFPPDDDPAKQEEYILNALKNAEIPFEISQTEVIEEEWANAWRQNYHPIVISERLAICPVDECIEPEAGQAVVRLDPGMAFGTGGHASTRLCLEALSNIVLGGEKVIDIGCGSGILSIAAALLGAGAVLAVDIDPVAVRTAKENCTENGTDDKTTVICGNILEDSRLVSEIGFGYDIICANIVADVIIKMAPLFRRFVSGGGKLICSGIIDERSGEVLKALEGHGFSAEAVSADDGWVCLVLSGRK